MTYRLTKIYTKQGDKGKTSLASGERVNKNHPRIVAIGEVDMLNSQVGLLLAMFEQEIENIQLQELQKQLTPCLHRLFDVGGELAMPEYHAIQKTHIEYLEQLIDSWNEELLPLTDFILPTGSTIMAQSHVCRSQARTAERYCQTLNQEEPLRAELMSYLNRLSDLFFVCARIIGKYQNKPEVLWHAAPKE